MTKEEYVPTGRAIEYTTEALELVGQSLDSIEDSLNSLVTHGLANFGMFIDDLEASIHTLLLENKNYVYRRGQLVSSKQKAMNQTVKDNAFDKLVKQLLAGTDPAVAKEAYVAESKGIQASDILAHLCPTRTAVLSNDSFATIEKRFRQRFRDAIETIARVAEYARSEDYRHITEVLDRITSDYLSEKWNLC